MFYVLVERQPTQELRNTNGSSTTAPAFLTNKSDNGQENIPVFLSRLDAYKFLKTDKNSFYLLNEFKLIPINSVSLNMYESIASYEHNRKHLPWRFTVVVGLYGEGQKVKGLALFNRIYEMHEIFYKSQEIVKEIRATVGNEIYDAILEDEKISDEEIINKVNKLVDSSNSINKMDPPLIDNLKESFSTAEIDLSVDPENHDLQNIGNMHVFILKNKDGTLFAPKENGCRVVFAFINKLDAVILSLIQSEAENYPYDVVALNSDQYYLDVLKTQYDAGLIKFRIAFGYLAISTPLGSKWAKEQDDSPMPSLMLKNCTFSEIENGYDLNSYFSYVVEKKEREQAIGGLITTNITPINELEERAEKFITDMRTNVVKAGIDDPNVYHRLIFAG